MDNRNLNLSREQIKQLSEANEELLENKIFALESFGRSENLNYREFWKKSEEIHSLFKKITPLENFSRKRLWVLFEKVRNKIKEQQAREKEIEKIAIEKISNEVLSLVSEIKETISEKRKKPFEVEILLYSLEQLKSALKGDISPLPDTPDKSFVSFWLKKRKVKLDETLKKEIEKTIEESEIWLKEIANEKYEEVKSAIIKLESEFSKLSFNKTKKVLREIMAEMRGPYLVKSQKEELRKHISKIYEKLNVTNGETEKIENGENIVDQVVHKPEKAKAGKIKEIQILLEELKQSVLKEG